ncbi:MAG: histone deacetylase family protein [Acidimicrobiales bacterium]
MTAGTVLLEMHPACADHDTGRGHPERATRLDAVRRGVDQSGVADATVCVTPRAARRDELERVHTPAYLDAVEQFCTSGGGNIDPDTRVSTGSWTAALVGAGAMLDATERLDAGEADAALGAVRPPGHHATPTRAMGFCLLNHVAVGAASLAARGERVLIVDFDAHHGNGTQEAFYADGRVTYLSLHEWPLYPGTGRLDQTGEGAGTGATINVPLPAGSTGDVYLAAIDELIVPIAERVQPTWLIISAGFDGHRADPLTGLSLSAGDFGDLTARLAALVPAGRRLVMLEGGYDLDALAASTAASLAALAGVRLRSETVTSGGPGRSVVDAARRLHLAN